MNIQRLMYLIFIFFLSFSLPNFGQTLVPYGASWSYYDNGNEPPTMSGTSWYEPGYDFSGWSTGNAQLGYGDGDESTVIDNGTDVGYFIHSFSVTNPEDFDAIELNLTYDDGAVVYLNGIEVMRVNMPCGAISYSVFAKGSSGDNATYSKVVNAPNLISGQNILAVEVHNSSPTNPDLSFDMEVLNTDQNIENFITFGGVWKYYDLAQQPPNDGAGNGWTEQGYDDSTWDSGNGQLGYGDGDEMTVINNSTLTGYFRKTFQVTDSSIFGSLVLNLLYDDGAVVYVNGNEVWRVNMPGGTISYGTFASGSSGDNATATKKIQMALTQGENIIAVEVHQRSAGSSDLSFDFELSATKYKNIPIIDFSQGWNYYNITNEPPDINGNSWTDISYDDSGWNMGQGELGYGDGDECTLINASCITHYFRKSFEISDPLVFSAKELNLHYDDGAVVYLNGVEVWRVNMPSGSIGYNTFASSTSPDNGMISTIINNSFVAGENVISVEVHQHSPGSSDISFDFSLTAKTLQDFTLERGPYLQSTSQSTIRIKWRTNDFAQSIVRYGIDSMNLNLVEMDQNVKTDHDLLISGLMPATKYYYQIETEVEVLRSVDSTMFFVTHPVIGEDVPTRAWILGDCGTANSNQRAVRDAYYNINELGQTDMVLLLGDNAYTYGTDQNYQFAIFENMYEDILRNTEVWSCIGNHDGYSANSSTQTGPYYDIFSFPTNGECGGTSSATEAYYSFDYGSIHFVILDSNGSDRSVGGAMYNWLQSDLQNNLSDWLVAIWHHPAYTKGSHNSDTEGALIEMRQNFLPLLENYGVDLVLNGHSHSYERTYFVHGHYGFSNTFDPMVHTVGATGSGSGRIGDTGAYIKDLTGDSPLDGEVCFTAGSSGKVSGGSLNHPAMYLSLNHLGSCVMDVQGHRMDMKFLNSTGQFEDSLTILKCGYSTIYVDSSATGSGTGESWLDAFVSIDEALKYDCISVVDTIKIAQGTYSPSTTQRSASYQWPDDIVIEGGYSPGGSIHNPELYISVLSGDIGVQGQENDNLYHVINVRPGQTGLIFKDLSIEFGHADGNYPDDRGSAVFCRGGVILDHVTIKNHYSNQQKFTVYGKDSCGMVIRDNCIIMP